MRRNLTLSVFVLLAISACTPVFGQKGWQVGVRAFPSLSFFLNSDDMDNTDYRLTGGVSAGVFGGYGFNEHISLVSNVLYANIGQRYITETYQETAVDPETGESRTYDIDVEQERRLSYMQLPIMFKYSTNAERKFAFFGQLGPQLGYLIGANDYSNDRRFTPIIPPYSQEAGFPYEEIDRYERLQVSAAAGVGLDIKLRFNLRMNIQLRGVYGILDVEDKDVEYRLRTNGIEETVNFWGSDRAATNPVQAALGIGFTYIFIPRFHY
ncbi:MAG: porin family protein [Bacteroidota bacterium]